MLMPTLGICVTNWKGRVGEKSKIGGKRDRMIGVPAPARNVMLKGGRVGKVSKFF